MARIRTIKPEFWIDGKIQRLSDSSALFFVALWTLADDYGFFSCDTLELSLRCPRWRPQSIFKMLSTLAVHGLIRVSTSSQVCLIVSWEHQKIKDRRASKWNDVEIQWDDVIVDAQGSDRIRLGVERRGEERRGVESQCSRKKVAKVDASEKERRSKIWESYREAYFLRYNVEPIRNGKVNSAISQIAKRLGEEAVEVVKFFLAHNDSFYLKNLHPISLCLSHAEQLHTQWKRDQPITSTMVRQFERTNSTTEQIEQIKRLGI